ncbi:MAG: ParA family protein [Desulfobulbaceae bacterium]|nr:ParA family protein [Desulfobulbaceae bacterium]
MLINCQKCDSRLTIEEAATLPGRKICCPHCHYVFVANITGGENKILQSKEARVIAVCNRKGGVAKTTTVLNMGASLAVYGKRVLLVDFDMQANLSIVLGLTNREKSFYDLLHTPDSAISEVVKKTRYKNLWVLPSNSKMALLAKQNLNRKDFVYLLRDQLESLKKVVDYIIIDTPPSIEFYTLNALMAADFVIIPTQCEFLSVHGVAHIEEAIKVIKERKDKSLDYAILVTMADKNSTAGHVMYKKLLEQYADKVLATQIEHDVKMQESQIMNLIVAQYDKKSPSARQYLQLAEEIEKMLV